MTGLIEWIWRRGIISTFLSGLFAVLPIVITVALVTWFANWLQSILGPDSLIGHALHSLGMQAFGVEGPEAEETQENWAIVIGWSVVLVGIWCIGLLVKSQARSSVENAINGVMTRIPIIKGVYSTVAQLVSMLNKDDQAAVKAMSVIFCSFGETPGAGFLALLASPDTYRFGEEDYHVVYIPTSPLPMSGGILFVPVRSVHSVDMSAEGLMQIYLSLGLTTTQVVPPRHIVATRLPGAHGS